MAIETGVFAGVLEEALTERDLQLQEKELPVRKTLIRK